MRRSLVLVVTAAVAALAPASAAAKPDLGTTTALDAGRVVYTTAVVGANTLLAVRRSRGEKALRARTIRGRFGLPVVTFHGEAGGLAPGGRVLVLAETHRGEVPRGPLRSRSEFTVVDARRLSVTRRIELPGHFSFDALSPNGRTLFLVEHYSGAEPLSYRVRAYDLRAGRLLPQPIVDKRNAGEVTSGMPAARVSSPDGRKVFTLYVSREHRFVHLLDTVARTAFCIDLPNRTDLTALEQATLRLADRGRTLAIRGPGGLLHTVDVKTLRVLPSRS